MEIIQYLITNFVTGAGLIAGLLISHRAKDEQALLKKHLKKAVLPIRQEIVYAIFALTFAMISQTNYLFPFAVILFLYGMIAGSFLFVQKRLKELTTTLAVFVVMSVIFNLVTTFLF